MRSTLRIIIIALFAAATVGNAFQVDFSKEGSKELFSEAQGALPEVSQGKLTLPGRIETLALPVRAGKKYKLQITAQIDGDFVVEQNDRAHIQVLQSHLYRLTSSYTLIFLDAQGNEIGAVGSSVRGVPAPGGFFLTKEPGAYVFVFYVPEHATAMKVLFQSNGRITRLLNFQLIEEREEGTVNPNPDFRYGELNYNGWRPGRDGRLYERPDGKVVLNSGYGGVSQLFPLSPENKYNVSSIGEGAHVNIEYFDAEGTSIATRFLVRPTLEGAKTEFVPPEGTAAGRLSATRNVLLHEIRIEKN